MQIKEVKKNLNIYLNVFKGIYSSNLCSVQLQSWRKSSSKDLTVRNPIVNLVFRNENTEKMKNIPLMFDSPYNLHLVLSFRKNDFVPILRIAPGDS